MLHLDKMITRVKKVLWFSLGWFVLNISFLGHGLVEALEVFKVITLPLLVVVISWFLVTHWVYLIKAGKRGGGLENANLRGAMSFAYFDRSSYIDEALF